MLVPTTHQAREIGLKVQAGDNMHGVERIITPDDFTASVFDKMRAIAGDEVLPTNKSSGVVHITPEDALKELIAMQQVSEQHPLAASQ